MNKNILIILFAIFLINGCVSHSAQYQALDVDIINNEPCFRIPIDSPLTAPIKRYPPSIMVNKAGRWESISSPGSSSQPVIVNAGECYAWSEISWQESEYDVVFKAISANGSERYATRFTLAKAKNGQLVLNKRE